MTVTDVRAPLGWLGPGRLIEDVVVTLDRGAVAFAGPAAERAVVFGPPEDGEGPDASPPPADEEIEVDGFLMPGVVDRHVHIALSDPGAVVAGGVTAVRDLGWPAEDVFGLAEASESPSFNGPLIRAVGPMITCPGGYPTRAGWAPEGTGLVVRGPEQAALATKMTLERSGIPVVKVALNAEAGPTLSDDELLAICSAASAEDAIVTAHVQGRGQAARAVGAGVAEFAHCPWTERLPQKLIESMAKHVRVVPTLDIHSYGRETPELSTAIDNMARFVAAGGRVAYGTDLGNGPVPAGIHAREILYLFRAGLSPERILEAVTFRPLAPGEPGSLVVLGDNPLETVEAYADVRLVIRGGRRFR